MRLQREYNSRTKLNTHRPSHRDRSHDPDRRTTTDHWLSSPPLVAPLLRCHPLSEGQANRMWTKGGWRCARQNSSNETIPLQADGNTMRHTSGIHVLPSNTVRGGAMRTPSRRKMIPKGINVVGNGIKSGRTFTQQPPKSSQQNITVITCIGNDVTQMLPSSACAVRYADD